MGADAARPFRLGPPIPPVQEAPARRPRPDRLLGPAHGLRSPLPAGRAFRGARSRPSGLPPSLFRVPARSGALQRRRSWADPRVLGLRHRLAALDSAACAAEDGACRPAPTRTRHPPTRATAPAVRVVSPGAPPHLKTPPSPEGSDRTQAGCRERRWARVVPIPLTDGAPSSAPQVWDPPRPRPVVVPRLLPPFPRAPARGAPGLNVERGGRARQRAGVDPDQQS